MALFEVVLVLLSAVVLSGVCARLSPVAVPLPLVQIAFGALIGSVADLQVQLDPELFFTCSCRQSCSSTAGGSAVFPILHPDPKFACWATSVRRSSSVKVQPELMALTLGRRGSTGWSTPSTSHIG